MESMPGRAAAVIPARDGSTRLYCGNHSQTNIIDKCPITFWYVHGTRIREVLGSIPGAEQSVFRVSLNLQGRIEFHFHLPRTFLSVFLCISVVSRRRPMRWADRSTWEFLQCPCDYDLFAKVKEPLRGTRYNTWDHIIRAIRWWIRTSTKMDALMVYDTF